MSEWFASLAVGLTVGLSLAVMVANLRTRRHEIERLKAENVRLRRLVLELTPPDSPLWAELAPYGITPDSIFHWDRPFPTLPKDRSR